MTERRFKGLRDDAARADDAYHRRHIHYSRFAAFSSIWPFLCHLSSYDHQTCSHDQDTRRAHSKCLGRHHDTFPGHEHFSTSMTVPTIQSLSTKPTIRLWTTTPRTRRYKAGPVSGRCLPRKVRSFAFDIGSRGWSRAATPVINNELASRISVHGELLIARTSLHRLVDGRHYREVKAF